MLLCYVDESGNEQILARPDAPPALVIAGLTVAEAQLKHLVWEFLKLKKTFNPQMGSEQLSDLIKYEVKGSDLRADLRSSSRRRRRRAQRFIDEVLTLLESVNATIAGCACIKRDNGGLPKYYYADSIASIAADFQAQLGAAGTNGLMILDAQTKSKNTPSVHGVTTRKFKTGGDSLPNLVESPVFGHSDAHVTLQIVDIVVSALIFPMACVAYCDGLTDNVHTATEYGALRERWGPRVRNLEHRYVDGSGSKRGGIIVRDNRASKKSHELYGHSSSRQRLRNGEGPRTKVVRRHWHRESLVVTTEVASAGDDESDHRLRAAPEPEWF